MRSQRETGRIVWVALREIGLEGAVFVDMQARRERSRGSGGGGGGGGEVEMERGRCVRKEYIYMYLVCSLGDLLTHRDGSRAQIPPSLPMMMVNRGRKFSGVENFLRVGKKKKKNQKKIRGDFFLN